MAFCGTMTIAEMVTIFFLEVMCKLLLSKAF